MVLEDTTVWIETSRRDGRQVVKYAAQLLLIANEATLCGSVEMKFLGGARLFVRERFQAWFNVITYQRSDQKISLNAALDFCLLRINDIAEPWNGLLIAGVANDTDWQIYSCYRHFEMMAPIFDFFYFSERMGDSNPD
jgi:hypothetical protein